jgi:uncharacterized membrane protein YeaQ/YmgE (transglycosylase-associated protein family)
MGIIITLIIGLIVGAVAKFLVPGKDPGGWIVTILLGIAGSFLGTYLGPGARALSRRRTGGFYRLGDRCDHPAAPLSADRETARRLMPRS